MPQKQVYLTSKRLAQLKAELEHTRTVRRQEVADHIRRSIDPGGTVNNAEYEDVKNEQAFVEGRILTLENMINNAVLIPDEKSNSGVVGLGSKVTVKEGSGKPVHYDIVGSAEADPKAGKISNESPVGRALLGKKAKDLVEVKAPGGVVKLTIVKVS